MNKQDLIKELKEKYNSLKKDLGLKTDYEDINNIFNLEDFVLEKGFVSDDLSFQIRGLISEFLNSWILYLNGLVCASSDKVHLVLEGSELTKEDKEEISRIIRSIAGLLSFNRLSELTDDKKDESKFIDDSISFWKKFFSVNMQKIIKKINKDWREIAKSDKWRKSYTKKI